MTGPAFDIENLKTAIDDGTQEYSRKVKLSDAVFFTPHGQEGRIRAYKILEFMRAIQPKDKPKKEEDNLDHNLDNTKKKSTSTIPKVSTSLLSLCDAIFLPGSFFSLKKIGAGPTLKKYICQAIFKHGALTEEGKKLMQLDKEDTDKDGCLQDNLSTNRLKSIYEKLTSLCQKDIRLLLDKNENEPNEYREKRSEMLNTTNIKFDTASMSAYWLNPNENKEVKCERWEHSFYA